MTTAARARSRDFFAALVAALAALAAGCAVTPTNSGISTGISPSAPQSAANAGANAAAPSHSEYIIGPGDTLRIVVLHNPDLSTEVPVRPDGKISIPLANDVVAVGKSPTQLARALESVLAEYIRSPTVSVIVTQSLSVFSQIKVVGQAVTPKTIPFHNGIRVLDVIIQVGGLSQFAAGNRAKIIRTEQGRTQVLHVRLWDLLNRGDVSQNLPMRPGDVLVIPESRF